MPRERTAALKAGTAASATATTPTTTTANNVGKVTGTIRQMLDSYGGTSSAQANQLSANSAYAAMAQSSAEAAANREFQERMWRETSAYNAAEAQKQRDWETEMSNTAYQRAMADMRAAGLNPILAYQQGGASTPSGASASVGTLAGAMGTGYSYQALQESSDTVKILTMVANTALDAIDYLAKDIDDHGGLRKWLRQWG